jgi:hypothetical protein
LWQILSQILVIGTEERQPKTERNGGKQFKKPRLTQGRWADAAGDDDDDTYVCIYVFGHKPLF